jgi:hypothetical protein
MQDKERTPDLGGPGYEELEKKVDEMLELEPEQPVEPAPAKQPKKLIIKDHSELEADAETPSAPPIDTPKAKKVAITFHDEEQEASIANPEPEVEIPPDEKPEKILVIDAPEAADKPEAEQIEVVEVDEEKAKQHELRKQEAQQVEQDIPTDEDIAEAFEVVDEETDPVSSAPILPESTEVNDENSAVEQADPDDEPQEDDEVLPEIAEPDETIDDIEHQEEVEHTDPTTERIIDEITAKDADALLAAEDEKLAKAFSEPTPKKSHKIAAFFAAWWRNPRARKWTIIGLSVLLLIAFFVPNSRYFLLNTFGVRSSATVTVLDNSTNQPLKNVRVTLANGSGTTNEEGKVRLEHLRLGTTTLAIEKRAFAADSRRITLGWGSNPLDAISLTPTGTQYSFLVTDFLSGKGIEKIEAQVEYASAYSDKEGKIKLTLAKDFEPEEFDVSIAGQNVRTEKIRITAKTTGEQKVQLVPAKQHVFISKRSGTYDVYKIDVDGKNEKVVVKGTGNEREDSAIISHPEHNIAALVSTRTGKRNQDGFLLSDLTLIEVTSKVTSVIAQSEKIQVIGWEGDRLVYVQIAAGTSAGNPKRHRLISYDYTSGTKTELASSNYFNDVMIAGGKVLFAPSSAYSGGTKPGLYRVNVDGSGQVQFTDKEVWSVSRKTYESVVYSIKNKWFELLVASGQTKSLDGAPSEQKNVVYVDIADHSKSIWTEKRDGKGALIMYEPSARKDTEKTKRSGLTNPLSWVSTSTVIFRVQTDSETADYAMSLDGGEARKVANVADTSGIESWYYY